MLKLWLKHRIFENAINYFFDIVENEFSIVDPELKYFKTILVDSTTANIHRSALIFHDVMVNKELNTLTFGRGIRIDVFDSESKAKSMYKKYCKHGPKPTKVNQHPVQPELHCIVWNINTHVHTYNQETDAIMAYKTRMDSMTGNETWINNKELVYVHHN